MLRGILITKRESLLAPIIGNALTVRGKPDSDQPNKPRTPVVTRC